MIIAAVAVAAGLTAVAATAEGMTRSGTTGAPPASATASGPVSSIVPGAAGGSGVDAGLESDAGPSASPRPAGSGGRPPSGTRAPSAAPGVSSPSASSQAPQPDAPLPEGFTWWADPLGYRVAVPSGWRQDAPLTGGRTFTATRDRAALGITPLAEKPSDVVATLAEAEKGSALDHYRRVRIEALPEPASAIWEYTFRAPDGTGMRAVQRIIGTADRAYVLEWRATREDWPTELNRFTVVLASFTPGP